MIKPLVTFFLFFSCFSSFCREKNITILFGPSVNSTYIKDYAVSTLPDQNTIFGFEQAIQIQSAKRIERFTLFYQTGKLYNHESTADPKFTKIAFDYFRIQYLLHGKKNFAGVGINLQTINSSAVRSEFSNNPTYNCFLTNLSPAFRAERRIINKKQRSVVFSLTNTISILAYIIRPSIGTVSPISYSDKMAQNSGDYFSSGKFVSINKFQLITSSAAIDFHLSRHFIFSIGYNWDFLHYRVDPVYYQINHQIFAHVGIKF